MADRYERYLMKQKLKEARHQAKLDAIRRKMELEELRSKKVKTNNSKIRAISDLFSKNPILVLPVMFILIYGFIFLMIKIG